MEGDMRGPALRSLSQSDMLQYHILSLKHKAYSDMIIKLIYNKYEFTVLRWCIKKQTNAKM